MGHKKKKKAEQEEEFSWDIEDDDEEEFSWEAPDEDKSSKYKHAEAETKTHIKDGKGHKVVNVTLGYNSIGLNTSEMIMEIVSMHDTIPADWGPQEWSEFLHGVGNIPFYLVCNNTDRYHMLLYAAEYFRLNPEGRNLGLAKLEQRIKSFDREKMEAMQSGGSSGHTVWGGVEYEDRPKSRLEDAPRISTVREQMEAQKKSTIDANRSEAVPMAAQVAHDAAHEAMMGKWRMAEKRAGQPRDSWEGKCDVEFEAMIKYCYGWLEDIGEVPEPYPMGTIDLFWQRPRPDQVPMDEKTVARRNYITYKIMKFWRKSLKEDGVKELIQFKPLSYRVTLIAMRLEKLIEMYATNWQTDDDGSRDEAIMGKIQKVIMKYFKAHFPIAMEGARPGPLATLDPPYSEYLTLCRKYSLEHGVLLHEADL